MKKIYFVFLSLVLFSCSNLKNNEELQKELKPVWNDYFQEDFSDTRALDVMVVTNRNQKNGSFGCKDDQFGIDVNGDLKFGLCKINVPKNHDIGEIELSKDGRQSSHDYFKILEAKSFDERDFFKEIKKSKRTPLIFVHGFNVRYQEAILRASQIAYDLKYQGPIVLFTWPSGGGDGFLEDKMLNKTYENNLAHAKDSIALFKKFLLSLEDYDIKPNLIVHSMGHQVVLPALKELSVEKSKKVFINELFLNAPDFDASEFSALVTSIKPNSNHITLYCSYNDKAMLASKSFNKNDRLGACTFLQDFDTINVRLVDDTTLGLGHGYYSSRAIMGDVFQTLLGIEADKRLFIMKSEPNSTEKYLLRR